MLNTKIVFVFICFLQVLCIYGDSFFKLYNYNEPQESTIMQEYRQVSEQFLNKNEVEIGGMAYVDLLVKMAIRQKNEELAIALLPYIQIDPAYGDNLSRLLAEAVVADFMILAEAMVEAGINPPENDMRGYPFSYLLKSKSNAKLMQLCEQSGMVYPKEKSGRGAVSIVEPGKASPEISSVFSLAYIKERFCYGIFKISEKRNINLKGEIVLTPLSLQGAYFDESISLGNVYRGSKTFLLSVPEDGFFWGGSIYDLTQPNGIRNFVGYMDERRNLKWEKNIREGTSESLVDIFSSGDVSKGGVVLSMTNKDEYALNVTQINLDGTFGNFISHRFSSDTIVSDAKITMSSEHYHLNVLQITGNEYQLFMSQLDNEFNMIRDSVIDILPCTEINVCNYMDGIIVFCKATTDASINFYIINSELNLSVSGILSFPGVVDFAVIERKSHALLILGIKATDMLGNSQKTLYPYPGAVCILDFGPLLKEIYDAVYKLDAVPHSVHAAVTPNHGLGIIADHSSSYSKSTSLSFLKFDETFAGIPPVKMDLSQFLSIEYEMH